MFLKKWICKLKYGEPVILVSGLPRSGTSMLMKMLDAAGLEIATDNIRTADEDNPKGYFELEKVKDLDKDLDKSWLAQYKGKVVKIISFLLPHLPDNINFKVIFVIRDIDEVIASQNKMLVRRGEPTDTTSDEKMKRNYAMHLRKVKYQLKNSPNIDVLYLNHRDVIQAPKEQAIQLNRFLGNAFNVEKVAGVVDPNLYRNRKE